MIDIISYMHVHTYMCVADIGLCQLRHTASCKKFMCGGVNIQHGK